MGTEEMWVIMRRGSWHSSLLLASIGVARLASVVSGCGRARERERETYRASEREQVIQLKCKQGRPIVAISRAIVVVSNRSNIYIYIFFFFFKLWFNLGPIVALSNHHNMFLFCDCLLWQFKSAVIGFYFVIIYCGGLKVP